MKFLEICYFKSCYTNLSLTNIKRRIVSFKFRNKSIFACYFISICVLMRLTNIQTKLKRYSKIAESNLTYNL